MSEISKDLLLTNEPVGYAREELIVCAKCAKSNAPDRVQCLYCGAALPRVEPASARMTLRKLEAWEKGVNLILKPPTNVSDSTNFEGLSKILSIEPEAFLALITSERPLPIARVENSIAASLSEMLSGAGIGTTALEDDVLESDKPPVRLRSIEFGVGDLNLKLFNSKETVALRPGDIALIVTGRIVESRRDEVMKRTRKSSKLIDESEIVSHESIADVYTRDDLRGYRITPTGFDFSSLGEEKEIRANENALKLIDELRDFAANALVVDDYDEVRHFLDLVWEPAIRKDSRGVRRPGFGKVEMANTFTQSNLEQFTRYSRMHRHLL